VFFVFHVERGWSAVYTRVFAAVFYAFDFWGLRLGKRAYI